MPEAVKALLVANASLEREVAGFGISRRVLPGLYDERDLPAPCRMICVTARQ